MRRESNDSDFQESLIDYFVIIGEQHEHQKDNNLYQPTILSTITSKYAKIPLINESFLLHLIYPNEIHLKDLKPLSENTTQYQKLLFSINIDNNVHIYHCFIYVHIFFEIYDKQYYPKAFCIISHYPCFRFYNLLCQSIEKSYYNKEMNIPIEVTLYNLICYLPPSVNNSINIQFILKNDLLFDEDISIKEENGAYELVMKDSKKTMNNYTINQMYCYPYFDFPICDIVNMISSELLVKIAIFNLLEISMVFFSENREHLNLIMYVISRLSYPFEKIHYYRDLISISKEEFLTYGGPETSSPVFPNMFGVFCKYEKEFATHSNTIFVDLDNRELHKQERSVFDGKDNLTRMIEYFDLIIDIIKKNEKKRKNIQEQEDSKFLYNTTQKLYLSLKQFENEDYKGKELLFDINSSTYNEDNNKIQNVFYEFYIEIMGVYFSFWEMRSNYDTLLEKYDCINVSLCKYKIERNLHFENYIFHEALFLKMLGMTEKSEVYLQSFISHQSSVTEDNKIKELSMFITFINNYKIMSSIQNINFLSLLQEYFTRTSLVKASINYLKFHLEYDNSIKSKLIMTDNNQREDIDLNLDLIHRYDYILSNMKKNEIKELFPWLKNVSKIGLFNTYDFSIFVFKNIINRTNSMNELIVSSFLMLTGLIAGNFNNRKQMKELLYNFSNSNWYYGDFIACLILFYSKLLYNNKSLTVNQIDNILKSFNVLVVYLKSTHSISNNTMINQINKICLKESSYVKNIRKERFISKEEKHINKLYQILLLSQNKNSEQLKKNLIKNYKLTNDIFNRETSRITFNVLLKSSSKGNKTSFRILSPMDLYNNTLILFKDYSAHLSFSKLNQQMFTESIANVLLYFDVIQELNHINVECFQDVLSTVL